MQIVAAGGLESQNHLIQAAFCQIFGMIAFARGFYLVGKGAYK